MQCGAHLLAVFPEHTHSCASHAGQLQGEPGQLSRHSVAGIRQRNGIPVLAKFRLYPVDTDCVSVSSKRAHGNHRGDHENGQKRRK